MSKKGEIRMGRYWSATVLLTLCVLVALGGSHCFADQLLSNPGFETWYGGVYWMGSGTNGGWNWTMSGPGVAVMWSERDMSAIVNSGTNALSMHTNGAGVQTMMVYQDVAVVPGAHYDASVYVRTTGTFGSGPNVDSAGLWVQELDAAGNLLVDHAKVALTSANTGYEQLTDSFSAGSTTAKVRLLLHTLSDSITEDGRAIYDDAALEGPSPTGTFRGTVTTTSGTPISGATVTIGTTSLTTGPDGAFAFSESYPNGAWVTLNASATGYETKSKDRLVKIGENVVDFELMQTGRNRLVNPGFDSPNAPYVTWVDPGGSGSGVGWSWYSPNPTPGHHVFLRRESSVNLGNYAWPDERACAPGPWEPYSGTEATRQLTNPGERCWLVMYQDAAVMPGSPYTASVWVKTVDLNGLGFGAGGNDKASLWVQELDASGNLVAEGDHAKVTLSSVSGYTKLVDSFTTKADTRKVRFQLETDTYCGGNDGWVTYDDAALEGDAVTGTVSGTVTSGESGVAGAKVTVGDKTAITGPDGAYAISDVAAQAYTARVDVAGYYSQRKSVSVTFGANTLDFDIAAVGNNLMVNPGFEDAWAGWFTTGTSVWADLQSTSSGQWGPVYHHSGVESMELHGGDGVNPGEASGYQVIPVLPGGQYSASVWFRGAWTAGFSSWGTESQYAQLRVTEYDAAGNLVATHTPIAAAAVPVPGENFTAWEQLTDTFTAGSNTAFVRVEGFAHIIDAWTLTLNRAIFDDFALNGPAAPLSAIRNLPVGAEVTLSGRIVTAAFNGFFYIEDPDRSYGIKVANATKVNPADIVSVRGKIRILNGERYINAGSVVPVPGGTAIAPVGLINRSTSQGLAATGLYVVVWGKVDSIGNPYTVTDGSGASIKVNASADYTAALNDYVRIEGALGCELVGSQTVPVLNAAKVSKQD